MSPNNLDQKDYDKTCRFCLKKISRQSIYLWDHNNFKVFICYKCKVRYVYFQDDCLSSYTMFTKINGIYYNISFSDNVDIKTSYINCNNSKEKKFEVAVISPFMEYTVTSLENVSHTFTPKNIKKKLKTYLLFL